jgi:hypothetical protein
MINKFNNFPLYRCVRTGCARIPTVRNGNAIEGPKTHMQRENQFAAGTGAGF